MARSVTVQFEDGTSHVYDNVPDDIQDSAVQERAAGQFNKSVQAIKQPGAPEVNQRGEEIPGTGAQPEPNIGEKAIAAAQIPLQVAAEHPGELAAGLGAYKAYQLANKFVTGKNIEAQAAADVARTQAQTAAEHQELQRLKEANRMTRAGVPNAPVAPEPAILDAQGRPIQSARVAAPVEAPVVPKAAPVSAPIRPAATVAESIPNKIKQFAAEKVLGPLADTAGAVMRNPIVNNPVTRFVASKPVQAALMAVEPGNAGQNYGAYFPQVGPMRGSELNPNTGRPWTKQELDAYAMKYGR